jgi:hypothetical protein
MKEPLGFPQTYIISTKYKTQQQMKQSLGFPQTYHLNKIQNTTTKETIPGCILLR